MHSWVSQKVGAFEAVPGWHFVLDYKNGQVPRRASPDRQLKFERAGAFQFDESRAFGGIAEHTRLQRDHLAPRGELELQGGFRELHLPGRAIE